MSDGPAEVWFYHLQRAPLEEVLPRLLERTVESGRRAVVLCGTPERMAHLDTHLWTYAKGSFLPHGTRADGNPDKQPVWLTDVAENPNGAGLLFLVDGAEIDDFAGWTRISEIFDGNDDDAVQAARDRWKRAKAAGCKLAYWQQSEAGRWEKKAEG